MAHICASGTDPAGGVYMTPTGSYRIRITMILGDIKIVIDLEIP